MKFTGQIKSVIPREQNYVAWLVNNGKTLFSKVTQEISLSVLDKYWPVVFLSQLFRYFPAFKALILEEDPELLIFGKCLIDS